MRMCVGCKDMKPKKELIRIVRSPEGAIQIDLRGKTPGRGAYICHSLSCLEKAAKNRLLERALEQKIENDIYQHLKSQLNEGESY
jgi:predicted RNA-binding protein YlxR (DUF448 family)